MIEFLDLKGINKRFEAEFQKQFNLFLNSGCYILGNGVKTFETNYANYCGTSYCIGVSNGLDALILIFKAYMHLGKLQKGDEVIVPANTYIATILAIMEVGLIPVLIEPNIKTFNCEALEINKHISNKTKAILIVHLYGQLADIAAVKSLALSHDLLLIEDAAQAHGAIDNNGNRAGNLGDAAGFSFYPSKNLGALGDAGAVTTNDSHLAHIIKQLRNYGTVSKYENERLGVNNRLDEIQALFLNVKLKALDDDNNRRRVIAKRYHTEINNKKVTLPFYNGSQNHIFHLYVVLVDDRMHFIEYLKSNKIQCAIHYPKPPHKQKALLNYNHLKFSITEKIHDCCVSIPMSPILSNNDVSEIIKTINAYH